MQLKLTLGGLQLEYEGDEGFFKTEIAAFLSNVSKYASVVSIAPVNPVKSVAGAGSGQAAADQAQTNGVLPSHSTDTVAKLLNAKTGPELIMAAVAKKILVDGEATVDRSTITAEMKKATSYFKRTYQSNLSNYLEGLTKADSLRLVSENVYGLPAKMREALLPKLHEQ
jgi:hypothetical protein